MTKAVGLTSWSLPQQHQHHLGTCWEGQFRGSTQSTKPESLRMDSSNLCFTKSLLGDLMALEVKNPEKQGGALRRWANYIVLLPVSCTLSEHSVCSL